ncbi:MAG: hypothetical protein C4290_13125, partial [Chloroflexota bacterium]
MTTSLFSTWRVTLVVQSALHIGDGTKYVEGADFVLEPFGAPTTARLIDVDRALALLSEREIAAARDGMIARVLGDERRQQVTIAELRLHRFRQEATPGEVLALIRDAHGRPYIPGSSLKGAFRSTVEKIAGALSTVRTCALLDAVGCPGVQGESQREFNRRRRDEHWDEARLVQELGAALCDTCK